MYLAEFVHPGTSELVNDLLIQGSEAEAREFAYHHAAAWGIELFSLVQATDSQVQLYQKLGRIVTLELSIA